jgi:hypothetical protein
MHQLIGKSIQQAVSETAGNITPRRAATAIARPAITPQLAEIETGSQSKELDFVIGTAIVAISLNPVIEIGVTTPHHAVFEIFSAVALRGHSSRAKQASAEPPSSRPRT